MTSRHPSSVRAAPCPASPRPPSGPAACSTSVSAPPPRAAGDEPGWCGHLSDRCLPGGRPGDLGHRSGHALRRHLDRMAPRRPRDHRDGEGIRDGGGPVHDLGRCLVRAGAARPGHAGVGLRRTRDARRPHPRLGPPRDRPGRARRCGPPRRGSGRGQRVATAAFPSRRSASTAACPTTTCSSRPWPTRSDVRWRSPPCRRPPRWERASWPGWPSAPMPRRPSWPRPSHPAGRSSRNDSEADRVAAARPLAGGPPQGRRHHPGTLGHLLLRGSATRPRRRSRRPSDPLPCESLCC